MNRTRSKSKPRLTRDGGRLVSLALGLAASRSRTEDRLWEDQLGRALGDLLDAHHDGAIDGALEHLFHANGAAYDELIDAVEGLAESIVIDNEGEADDVLLISAPLIASSKYSIPAGAIAAEHAQALGALMQSHVLASGARLAFAAHLFSIEHLPKKFSAMRDLTRRLAQAALSGEGPTLNLTRLPETPQMLADVRFLIGAVAAPRGEPLFRWQEAVGQGHAGRAQCLQQWLEEASPVLTSILAGCQFECLLPDAYFANAREADRKVRPVALRSAVGFLTGALRVAPTELRAVVAGFGETRVDEYRVGFTQKEGSDVLHGVVWPLYEGEDEHASPTPIEDIEICLRAAGVTRVDKLNERFAPEFCADCGAPLFPDPAGEVVHAEMPEEAEVSQNYLH